MIRVDKSGITPLTPLLRTEIQAKCPLPAFVLSFNDRCFTVLYRIDTVIEALNGRCGADKDSNISETRRDRSRLRLVVRDKTSKGLGLL